MNRSLGEQPSVGCGGEIAGLSHGPGMLEGLSALAGRSYSTTSEATAAILNLIADQLGMRTAYLSRIERERHRLRIVSAYNADDGCDVATESFHLLEDTY